MVLGGRGGEEASLRELFSPSGNLKIGTALFILGNVACLLAIMQIKSAQMRFLGDQSVIILSLSSLQSETFISEALFFIFNLNTLGLRTSDLMVPDI